jgi:hypothetical protein
MSPERKELKRTIHGLRSKGMTMREIAERLTEDGIVNPKTSEPYTVGGVHFIMRSKERRSRRKVASQAKAPAPKKVKPNTGSVVAAIASMRSVSADDRLALIELVMGL